MLNNVLILSEVISPHGSGGEVATEIYTNLLVKAGFNVCIVTNKFSEEANRFEKKNMAIYRLPLFREASNLKYLTLEKPGFLFSNFMKQLIAWADVVYIPRCWYSAIPLVKALKKPVVVHLHSYNLTCPVGSMYDFSRGRICRHKLCTPRCILTYEKANAANFTRSFFSASLNLTVEHSIRQCIKLSDALICVSKAEKEITVNLLPSFKEKIKVVYNPLPDTKLLPLQSNDMGYFGGPNLLKGYGVLLKALNHVHNATIHATNFGFMNNEKKSFGSSKLFFHNRLSQEDYRLLYQQISTVLVPSIWPETWGYVVTEALLSGRLIIASPSGGIPEQINGLKGCFTFENGNYLQFAELLNYARNLSMDTIIDLGIKNREAFTRNFNNELIFKEFLGILENVCRCS